MTDKPPPPAPRPAVTGLRRRIALFLALVVFLGAGIPLLPEPASAETPAARRAPSAPTSDASWTPMTTLFAVAAALLAGACGLLVRRRVVDARRGEELAQLRLRLRRAESELAQREGRFRSLIEFSPQAVFLHADGRFIALNAAAMALFGASTPDQLIGALVYERVHPDFRAIVSERMRQLIEWGAGTTPLLEGRMLRLDGTTVEAEVTGTALDWEGRCAILSIIQDVSERKRTLAALREREENFRVISESAPVGIVLTRVADARIAYANPRLAEIWGVPLENLVGRNAVDFYEDPDDRAAVLAQVEMLGRVVNRRLRFRRADGSARLGLLSASRTDFRHEPCYFAAISDVTEQEALAAQLAHSQRLEAIGHMTGGIAHDFNNLLQVILGNSELLIENVAGDSEAARLAASIREVAQRGADLTRRLLVFARRQELRPESADVNALIRGLSDMMRRTLGEQIEIRFLPGAEPVVVEVDRHQLENALINLAVNARDAMPAGGRLTIETARALLDADYAAANPDVTAGDYALIAVSDTGCGISPANLERVFEPFFTTKEIGEGGGLGLSMVYGFVRQSGGHIKIYSEVGIGTTFRLYLPLAGAKTAARATPAGPAEPAEPPLPRGHETVLVVEDDRPVRIYVVGLLESLGYRVHEAADGPEALAALDRLAAVELLFTDVVLPGGINGRELARQMQQRRPGLKVLFTSGYTRDAIHQQPAIDPGERLLPKPYRRRELARMVREVLNGG